MNTADNFLHSTQDYFTPETLRNLSKVLGQPVAKIQSGFKSVIPTFLMGVVNKGNTEEGASTLVELVEREKIDGLPSHLNLDDESYVKKGNETVHGIFGNNLSSITSTLSKSTGLKPSLVSTLMGLIAPVAMGVLASKVRLEKSNTNSLMSFLNEQKSNIIGLVPQSILSLLGGSASGAGPVAHSTKETHHHPISDNKLSTKGVIPHYADRTRLWTILGLVVLVILTALWWSTTRQTVAPRDTGTIYEPQVRGF